MPCAGLWCAPITRRVGQVRGRRYGVVGWVSRPTGRGGGWAWCDADVPVNAWASVRVVRHEERCVSFRR